MSRQDSRPVALITGSAHRLGACSAQTLHARGFDVVIHYHSSAERAAALQRELTASRPDSALIVQADLAVLTDLERLASESLAGFGRLDLLVNNASRFYPTPLGDVSPATWDDLVNTNLRAPFFLAQSLQPALRDSRGCIVNITDVYGHRPLAGHPVYSMSKAALIMLTKALAREMGPDVRVNAVSPGAILWPEEGQAEDVREEILQSTTLKRRGAAEDIAETVAFLATADYISGQVIAVDGGRLLHI